MNGNQEEKLRKRVVDAAVRYFEYQHRTDEAFKPGQRIPYGGRMFDQEEICTLIDSALDFWLTSGRYAEQFEKRLADFLGVEHCSLVNSGSSANLLAFMALTSPTLKEKRILRGDEVITLAAGFPTTVAPIVQYGAIPVFVDISLPTYNIDCSLLESALTQKTKAVILAHTLGNPFDLQTVKNFCEANDLWLIEDNCDALGSRYRLNGEWKYTGSIGDLATSSFYASHHITTGEGGAVMTNNSQLKRLVESFRDWGRDCWCPPGSDNTCKKRFAKKFAELPYGYDHKYVYSHLGYNLKITDMQAAIGCVQLQKLPAFIAARKKNWELLRLGLIDLEDRFILPEATINTDPSWFGFMLTVQKNAGFTRERMIAYLEEKGIQTRMLFGGNMLKHPAFDELRNSRQGYRVAGELQHTDTVMENSFWVGVYPGISAEMIEYLIDSIINFVS